MNRKSYQKNFKKGRRNKLNKYTKKQNGGKYNKKSKKKNNVKKGGSSKINKQVKHGSLCGNNKFGIGEINKKDVPLICKKSLGIPFSRIKLKSSLKGKSLTPLFGNKYFKKLENNTCKSKRCWHRWSTKNKIKHPIVYQGLQDYIKIYPSLFKKGTSQKKSHQVNSVENNKSRTLNNMNDEFQIIGPKDYNPYNKNNTDDSSFIPNMYNNDNGCYANSILQLLFQLDKFNEDVLTTNDDELYGNPLINYKELLNLRQEAIKKKSKIDKADSEKILSNLGHNSSQEDSAEFLGRLFSNLSDEDEEEEENFLHKLHKLFYTSLLFITEGECGEELKEKKKEAKSLILKLEINENKDIQGLINSYLSKKEKVSEEYLSNCDIVDLDDDIIKAIKKFLTHYNNNDILKGRQKTYKDFFTDKNYFNNDAIKLLRDDLINSLLNKNNKKENFDTTIKRKFEENRKNFEDLYQVIKSANLIRKDLFIKYSSAFKSNKIKIDKDHQYLIIQLKIFYFNNITGRSVKIESKNLDINELININNIDGNNVEYELVGYNAHNGKTLEEGGHYVTYINKNNKLYLLNDLKVDNGAITLNDGKNHRDYKNGEGADPFIIIYKKKE